VTGGRERRDLQRARSPAAEPAREGLEEEERRAGGEWAHVYTRPTCAVRWCGGVV
jgi:hypothetical protein